MDEKEVNIQIEANQVKHKSNSLVDHVPEWKRHRTRADCCADDSIVLVSIFEITVSSIQK
jgi:hypothetical protein